MDLSGRQGLKGLNDALRWKINNSVSMFTCIIATLEWNSNQLLNESSHVVRITNYSDSKTKASFVMISKQITWICFKIHFILMTLFLLKFYIKMSARQYHLFCSIFVYNMHKPSWPGNGMHKKCSIWKLIFGRVIFDVSHVAPRKPLKSY